MRCVEQKRFHEVCRTEEVPQNVCRRRGSARSVEQKRFHEVCTAEGVPQGV